MSDSFFKYGVGAKVRCSAVEGVWTIMECVDDQGFAYYWIADLEGTGVNQYAAEALLFLVDHFPSLGFDNLEDDEHATMVTDLQSRLDRAEVAVAKRDRLIRWLARTYGDNDPIFPSIDINLQALEEAIQLSETWCEVVRYGAREPRDLMSLELLKVSGAIQEASETGNNAGPTTERL